MLAPTCALAGPRLGRIVGTNYFLALGNASENMASVVTAVQTMAVFPDLVPNAGGVNQIFGAHGSAQMPARQRRSVPAGGAQGFQLGTHAVILVTALPVGSATGVSLEKLDNTFIEMIKASVDKPLPITVYNYKSMTKRDVSITPSNSWGGQGMLGVTIRFDTYANADENLVRVLEVVPGSPSHIAGLKPEDDYLLGTAERVFKDPNILLDEVTAHLDQPMAFYVYNTKTDEVRVAVVLPTNAWGGDGCLGAEVGHGYLHRLPQSCRSSTATSVMKGISILALDATGGGNHQPLRSARIEGANNDPTAGVPSKGAVGGERGLEQKSGSSAGVGVSVAAAPGGAGQGAGRGVIDVDLSG